MITFFWRGLCAATCQGCYVDDYAPNGYHDLESVVSLPVYIKSYTRKNGEPSYTLNVQKDEVGRGEHF